jgi:hypothetical protein
MSGIGIVLFSGGVMAKLFFEYKTIPYLFDTKLLKLFRLENKRQVEIVDSEILRNIRFGSIEIDRKQASVLAKRNEY